MSLAIQPFETVAATLLAGLVISAGQKGNGPAIVKRANTAIEVATALTQLAQGNVSPGLAALEAALNDQNLDPAVVAALQQASNLLVQQANLLSALGGVLNAANEVIVTNIAAGITAAANAELAKYGTPPAPAA